MVIEVEFQGFAHTAKSAITCS